MINFGFCNWRLRRPKQLIQLLNLQSWIVAASTFLTWLQNLSLTKAFLGIDPRVATPSDHFEFVKLFMWEIQAYILHIIYCRVFQHRRHDNLLMLVKRNDTIHERNWTSKLKFSPRPIQWGPTDYDYNFCNKSWKSAYNFNISRYFLKPDQEIT